MTDRQTLSEVAGHPERRHALWASVGEGTCEAFMAMLLAPSLWPFASVADVIGIEGAYEACLRGELPAEAVAKLAELRYTGDEALLPYADLCDLQLTAMVRALWARRPKMTLSEVAQVCGVGTSRVRSALVVSERYVGCLPKDVRNL